jgi:diaminohydroxyphosphoribosylaminopyrimidine deaminase/5-amino-6-(5-phosphoribosylamino)uracil reductase
MRDEAAMRRAVELAASVRTQTSPNPWVGCVIVSGASTFEGAHPGPGQAHAEAAALAVAGGAARGATLYCTLEPCAHVGRTGPCADAIVAAGVSRVVVGVLDPDPHVSGRGLERLRQAGIDVSVGVEAGAVEDQLAPYLKHRRTGRPWVVLKLAATLDGRAAAPDGTSRWITGPEARADAHRLRSESDAVLVGAGTVRADDPELTVRLQAGPGGRPEDTAGPGGRPEDTAGPGGRPEDTAGPGGRPEDTAGEVPARQPLRVVLGRAPEGAKVHPALELTGDLGQVLDDLGRRQVLQVLVEGGPTVAHDFHALGLVDRYVVYLAPALLGGSDGRPVFEGPGAPTIGGLWRGRLWSVERLGEDLRIELSPASAPPGAPAEAALAGTEAGR